jgi:hypothetical protein
MGSETGSNADMVKVTPGPSRTVTPSRTATQFYNNTTHSKYSTLDQIQERSQQGSQSHNKYN